MWPRYPLQGSIGEASLLWVLVFVSVFGQKEKRVRESLERSDGDLIHFPGAAAGACKKRRDLSEPPIFQKESYCVFISYISRFRFVVFNGQKIP